MTALVRHRCPTALAPLPAGDGLLARLVPHAATLTSDAAERLDRIAARSGNGLVEITGRGNLQVRGLRDRSLASFVAEAGALGLATPHLEASPLLGQDRRALATYDALDAVLADLPGRAAKFTVRVEAGACPTRAVPADLRIVLEAGGIARLEAGPVVVERATVDEAVALARSLAPFRIRHLARDTVTGLVRSAGLVPLPDPAPGPPCGGAPDPDPLALPDHRLLGLAPSMGAFEAGQLGRLAALARRAGDGRLRFAPRTVVLCGIADRDRVRAAASALGFVVDPSDPRRRLVSCAGAPLCASADAPARQAAAALLGLVPQAGVLHVSGCTKGCAHPDPAALVLVGQKGGGYLLASDARADHAGPAA